MESALAAAEREALAAVEMAQKKRNSMSPMAQTACAAQAAVRLSRLSQEPPAAGPTSTTDEEHGTPRARMLRPPRHHGRMALR